MDLIQYKYGKSQLIQKQLSWWPKRDHVIRREDELNAKQEMRIHPVRQMQPIHTHHRLSARDVCNPSSTLLFIRVVMYCFGNSAF